MTAHVPALDLRVRLLGEPSLWYWEIVDRNHGGALVQSSWAADWAAYETREEALTAGRGRLAGLQSTGADTPAISRKGGAPHE
jgi:hypothetical protein